MEADDLPGWRQRLIERLGRVASDDYSMQIACVGFAGWKDVRQTLELRKKTFDEQYGKPLSSLKKAHDDAGVLALWRQYRTTYL
jgi:hypothetical protein